MVKAFDNSDLDEIGLINNVYHVRHALALFERRSALTLERFTIPSPDQFNSEVKSFQEAWFAGTHNNIGGGCKDDGLALWPLQWILSEAQKYGLVLRFTKKEPYLDRNPQDLIFPEGIRSQMPVNCINGIVVMISELSDVFTREGYHPCLSEGGFPLVNLKERKIFEASHLVGQVSNGKSPSVQFAEVGG